jgi:ribonuclease HI
MSNISTLKIYTDGASKSNPGHAGCGIVLSKNEMILFKEKKYLGIQTNNQAEYEAVILAYQVLLNGNFNFEKVIFNLDSELVVNQLNNQYKVKSDKIKILYEKVKFFEKKLKDLNKEVIYFWIPREKNKLADKLANLAIKEYLDNNFNHNKYFKREDKKADVDISINKINLNKKKNENDLILDKFFFGKNNCLRVQINKNYELYFHLGILEKENSWRWEKVKINEIEAGQIINILNKDVGNISFFHKFGENTTQIWIRKNENSFSIKFKNIVKGLSIGEFEVLRIILEKFIILSNFKTKNI